MLYKFRSISGPLEALPQRPFDGGSPLGDKLLFGRHLPALIAREPFGYVVCFTHLNRI